MPAFLLILAIIFPGDQPPAIARQPMTSAAECLKAAEQFLGQDPKEFGAMALSAACAKRVGAAGDPA